MKHYPRLKKIILGLNAMGMAMLAGQVPAASWDSPTMSDAGAPANLDTTIEPRALDPNGLPVAPDVRGLGPYRVPVAQTPGGQLDSMPPEEPAPAKAVTGSIAVEGMYTRGDNKSGTAGSNKFNEYLDMSNGVFVSHFDLSANSGTSYLNAEGGDVGRTDQNYDLQFGQDNDWKVRGSLDEDDHVYSETVRPIFPDVGPDPQ